MAAEEVTGALRGTWPRGGPLRIGRAARAAVLAPGRFGPVACDLSCGAAAVAAAAARHGGEGDDPGAGLGAGTGFSAAGAGAVAAAGGAGGVCDPFGCDDFVCGGCSGELSNLYLACDGCRALLGKPYHLCLPCHRAGAHVIAPPQPPPPPSTHAALCGAAAARDAAPAVTTTTTHVTPFGARELGGRGGCFCGGGGGGHGAGAASTSLPMSTMPPPLSLSSSVPSVPSAPLPSFLPSPTSPAPHGPCAEPCPACCLCAAHSCGCHLAFELRARYLPLASLTALERAVRGMTSGDERDAEVE